MGVREVRAGAAELRGAGVHARDEIGDRAADVLRDHVAGVVGRGDHRAVEKAFERHRLLLHDVHAAAADDHIKIKSRLRRDRVGESDLAGLDILHGEKDGHHLRERGGIEPLVGIFRIEDRFLVTVLGEEHGGVRRVDPRIVDRHGRGRDEPQRERGDKSAYQRYYSVKLLKKQPFPEIRYLEAEEKPPRGRLVRKKSLQYGAL